MAKITKITNEQDYDAALERLEEIFFAKPGTEPGDEMNALVNLIEAYEDIHYPMIGAGPDGIQPKLCKQRDLDKE